MCVGIVGFNRSPRASKPAREIKLAFEKEKVKTQTKDKAAERNEEMEVSLKKQACRTLPGATTDHKRAKD